MASWQDILHIGGGNGFLPDDFIEYTSLMVLLFFSSFLPFFPIQFILFKLLFCDMSGFFES